MDSANFLHAPSLKGRCSEASIGDPMKATSPFLQGPISLDYGKLLESDLVIGAAAAKKPPKKKKTRVGTDPAICTVDICKKKKADAFLPSVAGWSTPPAPPQL